MQSVTRDPTHIKLFSTGQVAGSSIEFCTRLLELKDYGFGGTHNLKPHYVRALGACRSDVRFLPTYDRDS